ncbi:serine/threonine-protein kinase BUD32 [Lodderomyces elongisporus NRRL YB-4239]|uniref:EKC/KEOPS complex subunit BUD32 n=1 Tax=Lodderomyces elongisporus (strain ATCC 11503 / CBS 2605 / JCM 1781 / NBRC 1676 / NRRL YB-4239) TaxID=379508 RepID=A5DSZ0_LODEL|nr:serine/threonine-protein kinase BUD32 [Lodderomyces elongisporus NRRL YB-4239]
MTEPLILQLQKHLPNIDLKIISQGAEALVFESKTHPYSNLPHLTNKSEFIIKYRPAKPYRHPKIDAQITKSRTSGEAKFMYKLNKLGIPCPSLILCDFANGIIWMEHLGKSLPNGTISSFKNWLWYLERSEYDGKTENKGKCTDESVQQLCKEVGVLIGRLHMNDMIHGDLTTSNIILQPTSVLEKTQWQPALIDFGLSSFSGLPEDKAVDLYVLERAILSTHSDYADLYNTWLLEGYTAAHELSEFKKTGKKKYAETMKRLEEVRLRGRKRSMLG